MGAGGALLWAAEAVMWEVALFAAAGFLLLGLSDLAVDLVWIGGRLAGRACRKVQLTVDQLGPARQPGLIAVFVPAWEEAEVIGPMLRSTAAAFGAGDWRIYVGCYPNDPATIAAVQAVGDPRIRLVVGPLPGPTTKADCLNRLWEALLLDEAAEGREAKAVVLHDAEDVVHSAELRVFDRLIEDHDLVQLPVLPLIDASSRWIGGHYADEFAESHGKDLIVRQSVGAALPSAGVGCAFSRRALDEIAAQNGGLPFDAESLTEDYEIGLRLGAAGASAAFVRVPAAPGRAPVITREYFPATLKAAVAQKSRWVTGIALTGWERLGWSGGLGERWMRLRDRQSLLAAMLLLAGYLATLLWILVQLGHLATAAPPTPVPPALGILILANLLLLAWRLAMRFAFVANAYGWREGLRSVPRILVSSLVAILAAWGAMPRYGAIRRTGHTAWQKTAHAFPAELPAE